MQGTSSAIHFAHSRQLSRHIAHVCSWFCILHKLKNNFVPYSLATGTLVCCTLTSTAVVLTAFLWGRATRAESGPAALGHLYVYSSTIPNREHKRPHINWKRLLLFNVTGHVLDDCSGLLK